MVNVWAGSLKNAIVSRTIAGCCYMSSIYWSNPFCVFYKHLKSKQDNLRKWFLIEKLSIKVISNVNSWSKWEKRSLNWNPKPKTSVSLFGVLFPKTGEKQIFLCFLRLQWKNCWFGRRNIKLGKLNGESKEKRHLKFDSSRHDQQYRNWLKLNLSNWNGLVHLKEYSLNSCQVI